MKTFLVHHRTSHHAHYSGYARLIDFMDDAQVVEGKTQLPYRVAQWLGKQASNDAGLYNSSSVQKEIEIFRGLRKAPQNETSIVHYLNAERDIRHVIKFFSRAERIRFCASFHKPPAILKERIPITKHLKQLHGAICVGHNQVEFIQNWLDLEKVRYIPHGVDVEFFKPAVSIPKAPRLLFVGQHLRDLDMLQYCLPVLLAAMPDLQVDIVSGKRAQELISAHSRIHFHQKVNDDQLLALYQQASLLFLPLVDATACNSILEGLACGLPIVTSSVGGNPKYLEGTENLLCDSATAFIEGTLDLLQSESKLAQLGAASRQKALDYSWTEVAAQIKDFYRTLV